MSNYELAIEECAKLWIRRMCYAPGEAIKVDKHTFSGCEVEGRKAKTLVARLLKEGYLSSDEDCMYVSNKEYEHIKAIKPNLASTLKELDYFDAEKEPLGLSFESGLLGVQKYMVEHPESFEFGTQATRTDWTLGWEPLKMGMFRERDYHKTVLVRDAAYTKRRERLIFEAEVRHLLSQNLAWGLNIAGFIESADDKMFAPGKSDFSGHGFGEDPSKWPEDLVSTVKSMRARIEQYTATIKAYEDVDAKVREYGGWPAFLAETEGKLRANLLREKDGR